jgi:hypothetical protein
MKISETTSSILENFSKINGGIIIQKGSEIKTISPVGNILASANVDEDFTEEVRIYNLIEFLNIKNLFPDSELVVSQNKIQIVGKSGSGAVIVQSQPDAIKNPHGKKLPPQNVIASFDLSNSVLSTIPKMQLTLPNVAIIGNGEKISVKLLDLKNSSSTVLEYTVGETDKVFEAHVLAESFSKVLKTDSHYTIDVSERIIHLKNTVLPLQYWITNEFVGTTAKFS